MKTERKKDMPKINEFITSGEDENTFASVFKKVDEWKKKNPNQNPKKKNLNTTKQSPIKMSLKH